jgi:cytochrome oxidase assembly protein ShyY1
MRAPLLVRRAVVARHRGEPALAELGQARIGRAAVAGMVRPMNADGVLALDGYPAPQAVERQPLDELVRAVGLAVEQQTVVGGPDEEVEQGLPLRGQETGPDR